MLSKRLALGLILALVFKFPFLIYHIILCYEATGPMVILMFDSPVKMSYDYYQRNAQAHSEVVMSYMLTIQLIDENLISIGKNFPRVSHNFADSD